MDCRRSTIATRALLELSYRGSSSPLHVAYPLITVLLADHFIGLEEGFHAIRMLHSRKLRLRVRVERELAERMPLSELINQCGVDDIVRPASCIQAVQPDEAEALFIPVLSLSLLNRIIQLDTGHPFVGLILQALCSGKPVGALSFAADPSHFIWADQGLAHAPYALKQEASRLLDKIKDFGIRLLEPDSAADWLAESGRAPAKKRVVTAEDIIAARKLGRTAIAVPEHAIITPLAADTAREQHIEIHVVQQPTIEKR